LELIQDEINTEEDLLYQQSLIGSIITRLSNRVRFFFIYLLQITILNLTFNL